MGLDKNTITCVCTANICRSPMAEKLLEHALRAEPVPLNSLKVVSAGVSAVDGEPPSANSVKALDKVGLELKFHHSQQLTRQLVEDSALILCMTESHRYFIDQMFPGHKTDVRLFRGLMPPEAGDQIPDPYGLSLRAYEACRDSMVEAIPHITRYLREKYL